MNAIAGARFGVQNLCALWRQHAEDRRGFAAVELALVMPVLMLMLFGIIQYGLLLFTYNTMLNAARESSRALALSLANETQARSTAQAALPNWVPAASWTIAAEDTGSTGTNRVRTTITVPSAAAATFSFVPMPESLTVSVVMLKEG